MLFSCTFGTFCVTIVLFNLIRLILRNLYVFVIGPILKGEPDFKAQGKWALVTGATDGIGKAYAEQLAAKGLNIILVSRSLEKLKNVAQEIEKNHKVKTVVIQADFTKVDGTYEHIAKQIENYDIGVLVNNVGMNYSHPEYFLNVVQQDNQIVSNLINCNILSVTNMCKLIMPGMIERKRGGTIINISSLAAQLPSPMLTVYGATKAFVEKFSKDLNTEYRKDDIVIQCVLPGFVATNMSKIKRPSWMKPTSSVYVQHALQTVNIQTITTGYYPHEIMRIGANFLQNICDRWMNKKSLVVMEKMKKCALKKAT